MLWKKHGLWIVLAILIASSLFVYFGERDEAIALDSVMEIWTDVLRDLDQVGLRVTRVSEEKEMELGRELARLVTENSDASNWQQYVSEVGKQVTQNLVRPGIKYEFHVVASPEVNAFAVAGGQVFITTGMLEFLSNEAELASVLGHEVAHVDLRHCIERLQYALAVQRIGASQLSQFAVRIMHQLVTMGYTKFQELEADSQGVRVVIQAGYDPRAAIGTFQRLQKRFGSRPTRVNRNPIDSVAGAIVDTLGSYTDTHPATNKRISRIKQLIRKKSLSGKKMYVGRENYVQRVAMSQQKFDEEWVTTDSPNSGEISKSEQE